MTIYYDVEEKIRFIVLYQDMKMKPTRISKTIGIPERTIYRWVEKIENDFDIFEKNSKNAKPRFWHPKLRKKYREPSEATLESPQDR